MKKIGCPVCGTTIGVSKAQSRKSKKTKTFLMLVCPVNGRHFRAFINDPEFISRVAGTLPANDRPASAVDAPAA